MIAPACQPPEVPEVNAPEVQAAAVVVTRQPAMLILTLGTKYSSSFCWPDGLALYLVRKAEVDIIDIPIAQITDEFFGDAESLGRT